MSLSNESLTFIETKQGVTSSRAFVALSLLSFVAIFISGVTVFYKTFLSIILFIYLKSYYADHIALNSPGSLKKINFYPEGAEFTEQNDSNKIKRVQLPEDVCVIFFHNLLIQMKTSNRAYFLFRDQLSDDDYFSLRRTITHHNKLMK